MKKKVSEIKKEQGWEKLPACCKTCKFFSSIMKKNEYGAGSSFEIETIMRCTIGNFKTGKTNWCTLYQRKENND